MTAAPEEPVLAVREIQGNVLPGFNSPHQAILAIRFTADPHPWLAALLPSISTLGDVHGFRGARRRARRLGQAAPADPADERSRRFGRPGQPLVWPGQFVFGYPRQRADDPVRPGPASRGGYGWMDNGSYLVFRRLRQDVAAFRPFVGTEAARLGMAPERLAALLVGRWPEPPWVSRTLLTLETRMEHGINDRAVPVAAQVPA